jgi:hypothetical protein
MPASAPASAVRPFLGLDALPKALDCLWRHRPRLTKHMRMPPQQFFAYGLHHIAKIERRLFLRQARVKDDLKQQIAEFLPQIAHIATGYRVGDLVGFLNCIRSDALEALLKIPRTAGFGRPQRGHDFKEPDDIARRFQGAHQEGQKGGRSLAG